MNRSEGQVRLEMRLKREAAESFTRILRVPNAGGPVFAGVGWRWRWDLNPRRFYPHTLSRRAPSAARTRHRGREYRTAVQRRDAKNSSSSAVHSVERTSP